MYLNREKTVNVDLVPTAIATQDTIGIPVYNIIDGNYYIDIDFTVDASTPTNVILLECGEGGHQVKLNIGSGKYLVYVLNTSMGNAVDWVQGERQKIRLIQTNKGNGTWDYTLQNLTQSSQNTINKTVPIFEDGEEIVINGSRTYVGLINAQYHEIDNNGDVLNTTQDSVDNLMTTTQGNTATIRTNYLANKPLGVHDPNYTDDNDYINQVVRADRVPILHENRIIILSENKPIEGATVSIDPDGNGVQNLISDSFGIVNVPAFNGDYTYNVVFNGYVTQNNIPFSVSQTAKIQRTTLVFEDVEGNPTIPISVVKSSIPLSGVEGNIIVMPDGIKKVFTNGAYNPFYDFSVNGWRKFLSVDELLKAEKGVVNETAIVHSYYGDSKGGGLNYKLVSNDPTGYVDNYGTTLINSVGDVWVADLSLAKSVEIAAFGIKGNGNISDSKRVIELLNYAGTNGLKIDGDPNGVYVWDSLTINDQIKINNAALNIEIDGNGAQFKRYWQVKNLPLKLVQKTQIGTFDGTSTFINEADTVDEVYKKLRFTFQANAVGFEVFYVATNAAVSGVAASVGDYIIVSSESKIHEELHKVISTVPIVTDMDEVTDASSTLRDRFFIANNDLTKRAKIANNYDFSAGVLDALMTSGNTFMDGDDLYLYQYSSEWNIADSTAEILIKQDSTLVKGTSVYKGLDQLQWKVYEDLDIPTHCIEVLAFKNITFKNCVFDDDRQNKDSLDLSICVDNNPSIVSGDKTVSWDWNSYINFNDSGGINTKVSFLNCEFKNNNMNRVVIFSATNVAEIDVFDCDFEDSGEIFVSSLNPFSRTTKVRTRNLKIKNPYFQYLKNGGVWCQDVEVSQIGIENENYPQTLYRLTKNRVHVSDVKYRDLMGRRKDEATSPFFNGKVMPRKNQGLFVIYGKTSTFTYQKSAHITLRDIKIENLGYNNKIEVDNDPVTGTFLSDWQIQITSNNLNVGGNILFDNVDLLGNNAISDPRQDVVLKGTKNIRYLGCTHLSNNSINQKNTFDSLIGDEVVSLKIQAMNETFTNQQEIFDTANFPISVGGKIVSGVLSTIPIGLAFINPINTGVHLQNEGLDYDNDNSLTSFDANMGGAYTQRSPEPTELDSAGNKKVVATLADRLTIESTVLASGFVEKYKGGFIEVQSQSVGLNAGQNVNQRYKCSSDTTNVVFWTKENEGADNPVFNQVFENVKAPIVSLPQIQNLSKDVKVIYTLRNVEFIEVGITYPGAWVGSQGKSEIVLYGCNYMQVADNTTRENASYSFIDMFNEPQGNTYKAMQVFADFPVVHKMYECGYFSKILGNSEPIPIEIEHVNMDVAPNLKYIYPQLKTVYHLDNGVLNLDTINLSLAKNLQEFKIVIDVNTPVGGQILFGGVTYIVKGNYNFKIEHTYVNEEIYVSSELLLTDRPEGNQTGTTLDLAYNDAYNMAAADTKNAGSYAITNPKANNGVRCLVQFTAGEIAGLTGGIPTFTGFTVTEVGSSEALIADTPFYMNVWCDDDTVGSEIIRMKIHAL